VALVPGATTLTLDGSVRAAWSDGSRGDLRPTGPGPGDAGPLVTFAVDAAATGPSRIDRVVWGTQVHGADVVVVEAGNPASGTRPVIEHRGACDALVTDAPGTALCVLTADCAPVALSSPEGVAGAVHAGWRGLVAGVIEAAVDAMRTRGASEVTAAVGPCIHASCYEFSPADLDVVAASYGDGVRATTTDGRPALDLVAGVAAAVAAGGARLVHGAGGTRGSDGRDAVDGQDGVDGCTACGGRWFSHRARSDAGRQAMLVWSTRPAGPGEAR